MYACMNVCYEVMARDGFNVIVICVNVGCTVQIRIYTHIHSIHPSPVCIELSSFELTRFSICPINDLNFGYMMFGTRKTCTFTLENKGEFEFKYAFIKLLSEQQKQRV